MLAVVADALAGHRGVAKLGGPQVFEGLQGCLGEAHRQELEVRHIGLALSDPELGRGARVGVCAVVADVVSGHARGGRHALARLLHQMA